MKQKTSSNGSISILVGVVLAILALVRGPAQTALLIITFAIWDLRMVLPRLRPMGRTRLSDSRAAAEQSQFSNRKVTNLLLYHVNYRITDYLKSAYPNVRWEWMTDNPAAFVVQGGTERIRIYGVEDYEYADVALDQMGGLHCSMVKVVPVQGNGQDAPSGQSPIDPQVWYELEGREILDGLIADLRSRCHSSLTLNEDGSVSIQPMDGEDKIARDIFACFPEKGAWPRLADVLAQEGLTADVQADHIAVSW